MAKKHYMISVTLFTIFAIAPYGCATLQSPGVEKKLFASQIAREQVPALKDTIISNGYKRVSKDDYSYMEALVTQYETVMSTAEGSNSKVQIMLYFWEKGAPSGYYCNLGISIINLDRGAIPEVNAEVDRIENILYERLLELAGKETVSRGARKDTAPQRPSFYAPYVGRPPPR